MWMSKFLEPKPLDQQIVSTRYRLRFRPFVGYNKNILVVFCPHTHTCLLDTVVMISFEGVLKSSAFIFFSNNQTHIAV